MKRVNQTFQTYLFNEEDEKEYPKNEKKKKIRNTVEIYPITNIS
jgi:hypothetical protein